MLVVESYFKREYVARRATSPPANVAFLVNTHAWALA